MNPADTSEKETPPRTTEAELLFVSLGIVNQVITRTGFASYLLFRSFKALHLQSADKQVVFDTVRGFLGNLNKVEFILQRHGGINFRDMPVPLLNLLRFGAFIVMDLEKNPKQILGLARMHGRDFLEKYGRFLERVMNFVARRGTQILADEGAKLPPRERVAVQQSFPRWIVDLWADPFGDAFMEDLCKESNIRPPQDLRVNVAKRSRERVKNTLLKENIPCTDGTIAPHALVVPNGIEVFKTTTFRRALFEMQDQGSQLATYLVDLVPGDVVLDYCAGNGGKTLHMGSLAYKMDPRPVIYASDISSRKLVTLRRRVKRSFVDSSFLKVVQQGSLPRIFQETRFTKIFVDAPCSGLGNLRRNPGIKVTCTPEDIAQLVEKQATILRDAAALCQVNARLIYVTCTVNPRENEEQVLQFVKQHPDFVILPFREGLQVNNPIMTSQIPMDSRLDKRLFTLYPPLTQTEGFFGAILEKTS
jgi:16S rRNA (cytosine967-C5)-methyltransferase